MKVGSKAAQIDRGPKRGDVVIKENTGSLSRIASPAGAGPAATLVLPAAQDAGVVIHMLKEVSTIHEDLEQPPGLGFVSSSSGSGSLTRIARERAGDDR